jgi:hypothetical protein
VARDHPQVLVRHIVEHHVSGHLNTVVQPGEIRLIIARSR